MNLAPNNRAARFAGWPDLWFFEHDDRLHAVTQQALDAAFEKALSDIRGGTHDERN